MQRLENERGGECCEPLYNERAGSVERIAEQQIREHRADTAGCHAVDRPEEEGAQQNDAVAEVYIPVRCGHGDMDKHRCGAGQRGKECGENKSGEFIVFHVAPPWFYGGNIVHKLDIFKYQFNAKIQDQMCGKNAGAASCFHCQLMVK